VDVSRIETADDPEHADNRVAPKEAAPELPQNHRPRPYQPPPPSKNKMMMMMRSVVMSVLPCSDRNPLLSGWPVA
jgi:hypothetical protein